MGSEKLSSSEQITDSMCDIQCVSGLQIVDIGCQNFDSENWMWIIAIERDIALQAHGQFLLD